MTAGDIEALMKGIAPAIAEMVARHTQPLVRRCDDLTRDNATLRRRVGELEAANKRSQKTMPIEPRRPDETQDEYRERSRAYARDLLARTAPPPNDEAIREDMRRTGALKRSLERQGYQPQFEDLPDEEQEAILAGEQNDQTDI